MVLGFSGLYHDSAAALLEDGYIIAAAQEERFTRMKNDDAFPVQAIRYCLDYKKISLKEVDAVVYYDNPFITLERYLKMLCTVEMMQKI
ncbi:nebramycin 5' synthase [Eubacterium plexicaudatum ASF492]|nr:nebramycin 5' synthase [Eubacterium plexicaudatum ASF492]